VNIYYESKNTECLRIHKYYSINVNEKEQQNTQENTDMCTTNYGGITGNPVLDNECVNCK
jgi:hypothetical protein